MFFRKRKKYNALKKYREDFESFLREDLKNVTHLNSKFWFEYMIIGHMHYLEYDNTQKIKLEERKIEFLKKEFPKRFEDFEKTKSRNIKLDNLLNE
jgi:hypothetical protein